MLKNKHNKQFIKTAPIIPMLALKYPLKGDEKYSIWIAKI